MELVKGHLVLEEGPAELGLVVDVRNLGDGGGGGGELGREDGGDGSGRRAELLEELGGDGEVVAAGKSGDLASVAERGTHDNGLVAVLLVVGVDVADRLDTGVSLRGVLLAGGLLEPVEDTADEGRDEGDTGLGTGDGLAETEEEGQVAVDALKLELLGSLDTLPGGGDLDENALLGDTDGGVEGNELAGLSKGSLSVERVDGVNLGRDTAGDNLEDGLAELDKEAVSGSVGLGLDVTEQSACCSQKESLVGVPPLRPLFLRQ